MLVHSTPMRLLFTECKEDDAVFFHHAFPDCDVVTTAETLARVPDIGGVEVLSVQVHSDVGSAEMERMPKLRLIVTRSTGTDHIDLDAAARRGIEVHNIPDYGAQTVAEHTLLLLLAVARRLHEAIAVTRGGRFDLRGLLGSDLAGKTAVVVGVGMIGERFARMAQAIGMRVLGVDPVERAELGIEYLPLPDALPQADALVLCCPLVEETRYRIDSSAFARLKRGALLVNIARGAVVHAPALLRALDDGVVAGAGLDVLEHEAALRGNVAPQPHEEQMLTAGLALMSHPRVIVTPHMAFYTREALLRLRDATVSLITDHLSRVCA